MAEPQIKHDGSSLRIYYYPIESFEEDLQSFSEYLESLEAAGEVVISVVTNTGLVGSSFLLGSSFQGVKGFGVVTRKTRR
jgi:hypothetical protein